MMNSPAPDPATDQEGFLAHSVTFARRIAGSGYSFDEEAYRDLMLEEVRYSHDPGGTGRQIAAIATAGDRRSRLRTIKVPTLLFMGPMTHSSLRSVARTLHLLFRGLNCC